MTKQKQQRRSSNAGVRSGSVPARAKPAPHCACGSTHGVLFIAAGIRCAACGHWTPDIPEGVHVAPIAIALREVANAERGGVLVGGCPKCGNVGNPLRFAFEWKCAGCRQAGLGF